MTVATKDQKCAALGTNGVLVALAAFGVLAATNIWAGTLVGVNDDGYALPATADATLAIAGVNIKRVDNTAGASGDLKVTVERGSFAMAVSGTAPTAANIGAPVYAVDDSTVSLDDASGTRPFAGYVDQMIGTVPYFVIGLDIPTSAVAASPTNAGLQSAANAAALHAPVANLTALKAIAAGARADGMLCTVLSDVAGETSTWRFSAASAAADTSENLVATPAAGTGRWLRNDKLVPLFLPVTFATADGAVIFTTPVGARVKPLDAWWEVQTTFAGGSSSAIGVDSSVTGWDTAGDLLGGAAGDVAATLVSTNAREIGTAGTKFDTVPEERLILIAADTLKFNRITSAFTAGVAKVRVLCAILANAGA